MCSDNSKRPDYSRDVTEDLVALSFCRLVHDDFTGCRACPFKDDKPIRYKCNQFDRLADSIREIMLQLSGEQADHYAYVVDQCSHCDEEYCVSECPCFDESISKRPEVFFQRVYEFLKDQGIYNEDGTVSEKGKRIRVSDTLALLKTTGLTRDSWTEERGGLLD